MTPFEAGKITRLVAAAKTYLQEATFPAWAGDDCRICDGDLCHLPACAYLKAEEELQKALKPFEVEK